MADPFLGEIGLFGFNFNPRGWIQCNGTLLTIGSNSALFSLLSTFYGGDGRTTFAVPDLRGRATMHYGRHPGSMFDWRIGQTPGEEEHIMSLLELPSHTHTSQIYYSQPAAPTVEFMASTLDGTLATPQEGAYLATGKPPEDGTLDKPEQLYSVETNPGQYQILGGVDITSGVLTGTMTLNNAGASTGFNLIQPTQAANYSIATEGTYPPRN